MADIPLATVGQNTLNIPKRKCDCSLVVKKWSIANKKFEDVPGPIVHPWSNIRQTAVNNESPFTYVKVTNAKEVKGCPDCKKSLQQALRIPYIWWSTWCHKSGCYYQSKDLYDEKGELEGHISWFRFDVKRITEDPPESGDYKYEWINTTIFTHWDIKSSANIVVVFDPSLYLEETLLQDAIFSMLPEDYSTITTTLVSPIGPYHIHGLIAMASIQVHDVGIWGLRDLIRWTELTGARDPSSAIKSLQAATRHSSHASELLSSTSAAFQAMLESHKRWSSKSLAVGTSDSNVIANGAPRNNRSGAMNQKTTDDLVNANAAIITLLKRAESLEKRANTEIQLAMFGANRDDTTIMKIFAFLGVIFVPPAFISNLFSMSFFNINDAGIWYVDAKFWIYWAITIPLTILASASLYFWYASRLPNVSGKPSKQDTKQSGGKKATPQEPKRVLKRQGSSFLSPYRRRQYRLKIWAQQHGRPLFKRALPDEEANRG